MPPAVRIRAGDLRHFIQILQQAPGDQDSFGQPTVGDESPIATVWAKIEALSGRELYAAQQKVSQVTHRITIRYMAGLKSGMKVLFNDPGTGMPRKFQIQDVENPDEIPHMLWLLCMERDDSAREP
jgi:SPP1 family predicted phage head-tail adaptor